MIKIEAGYYKEENDRFRVYGDYSTIESGTSKHIQCWSLNVKDVGVFEGIGRKKKSVKKGY